MRNAILDTNVLVAGLRSSRGASFALLHALDGDSWRPSLSVSVALEYEAVLRRPGVVEGLSQQRIDEILDYFIRRSTLVRRVRRLRPVLRDPNDEAILELAVQCGADIVTHNVRDFAEASRFAVRVLTPRQFLLEIEAGQ